MAEHLLEQPPGLIKDTEILTFHLFCLCCSFLNCSQRSWRLFTLTLSGRRHSRRPSTAVCANRSSVKMASSVEVKQLHKYSVEIVITANGPIFWSFHDNGRIIKKCCCAHQSKLLQCPLIKHLTFNKRRWRPQSCFPFSPSKFFWSKILDPLPLFLVFFLQRHKKAKRKQRLNECEPSKLD